MRGAEEEVVSCSVGSPRASVRSVAYALHEMRPTALLTSLVGSTLVGAVGVSAAACSGSYDPASQDAGTVSPQVDASGVRDSSTTSDAAMIEGGTGTGCLFCDEFDDGTMGLTGRWDELKELAGPMDLDTSVSVSAPRSLRLIHKGKAGVSGASVSALVKRIDVADAKRITVDLDFQNDLAMTSAFGEIDPVVIGLLPPPNLAAATFALLVTGSGAKLQRYADNGTSSETKDVAVNLSSRGWHHLTFKLVRGVDKISCTVVGDAGVESDIVEFSGTTWTSIVLKLGANYTRDSMGGTLRFDNVAVRIKE